MINAKRGFTLIELLVVMGIVAVVSATGFTTYSKTQITTRDDRRISDLHMIQAALELYYQANKHYPYDNSTGDNPNTWVTESYDAASSYHMYFGASNWLPELDPYISQVPADPLNNQQHLYFYYSVHIGDTDGLVFACPSMKDGQFYVLQAFLENTNNPYSQKNKNYTECNGVTGWPANMVTIQDGWTPATCPIGETSC